MPIEAPGHAEHASWDLTRGWGTQRIESTLAAQYRIQGEWHGWLEAGSPLGAMTSHCLVCDEWQPGRWMAVSRAARERMTSKRNENLGRGPAVGPGRNPCDQTRRSRKRVASRERRRCNARSTGRSCRAARRHAHLPLGHTDGRGRNNRAAAGSCKWPWLVTPLAWICTRSKRSWWRSRSGLSTTI
jgi:hypothetical protein